MKLKLIRYFLLLALFFVPIIVFANSTLSIANHPHSNPKFAMWALILGGLSAISLPLGSLLGLVWKPSPRITAIFTAFGGGALLAALSIELVAPTVMMAAGQMPVEGEAISPEHGTVKMIALIVGCVLGGLFFFILNEMLNQKGGYLRKISTTITHFNRLRREKYKRLFKRLSKIELFNKIPSNQIQNLIRYLEILHFKPGEIIFNRGEMAAGMYFINHGVVDLQINGKVVRTVNEGEIIGEISLLYHIPSKVSAVAKTKVSVFELMNEDFDKIRDKVPEIEQIAKKFAETEMNEESHFIEQNHIHIADAWSSEAIENLHHSSDIPTQNEVLEAAKSNNSAPLAIWLGIFLDGIPESFVIGAGFLLILTTKLFHGVPSFSDVIPYTLIAGLFLSNFPEAMSSTIGMRNMGWKPLKILSLWISLMIMTAVGAIFGYYFSNAIPETLMIGVEGLAAGAMLTMIAQTMIPEAVHIGGHRVVGLGTLSGYLAAVAFKILE